MSLQLLDLQYIVNKCIYPKIGINKKQIKLKLQEELLNLGKDAIEIYKKIYFKDKIKKKECAVN